MTHNRFEAWLDKHVDAIFVVVIFGLIAAVMAWVVTGAAHRFLDEWAPYIK